MRPIEFRGKREKDGEWVYGFYVESDMPTDPILQNHSVGYTTVSYILKHQVDDYHCEEVRRDTIGQFTGLTDKNGNKIFEGDILWYDGMYRGVVMWHPKGGYFYINDKKSCALDEINDHFFALGDMLLQFAFYVHGNIYDNPDLTK